MVALRAACHCQICETCPESAISDCSGDEHGNTGCVLNRSWRRHKGWPSAALFGQIVALKSLGWHVANELSQTRRIPVPK